MRVPGSGWQGGLSKGLTGISWLCLLRQIAADHFPAVIPRYHLHLHIHIWRIALLVF